jgi:hypothetical protein
MTYPPGQPFATANCPVENPEASRHQSAKQLGNRLLPRASKKTRRRHVIFVAHRSARCARRIDHARTGSMQRYRKCAPCLTTSRQKVIDSILQRMIPFAGPIPAKP